jgi:hypothetical protein
VALAGGRAAGASVNWTGILDGKFRVNNWGTGSSLDQRTYRLQTNAGWTAKTGPVQPT